MHVFRDSPSIRSAVTQLPEVAPFIARRIEELSEYTDYELGDLVHVFVVQPGDSLWVLNEVGSEGVSPYVFPSPATGKPYTTITRAWYCIRKEVGLPDHVRIHDLRHSAASKVACETGSLVAVQHQLGHVDGRMAARYAHPMDKTMQAAARAASVPIPQRAASNPPLATA